MRRLNILMFVTAIVLSPTLLADEELLYSYPDADARTTAILNKVESAFGGRQRLESVRQLHRIVRIDSDGKSSESQDAATAVESLSDFPSRYFARVRTAEGTLQISINDELAYIIPAKSKVPNAAIKITQDERDELVHYFSSDPLFGLKMARSSRCKFGAGKERTIGTMMCEVLHVYADGLSVDWMIDPASGRVVQMESGGDVSELSDWRSVGGLTVPFRSVTKRNGSGVSSTKVERYRVNPEVDLNALFRTPTLWLTRWVVYSDAGRGASNSYRPANSGSSSRSSSFSSYKPPTGAPLDVVVSPFGEGFDYNGNPLY